MADIQESRLKRGELRPRVFLTPANALHYHEGRVTAVVFLSDSEGFLVRRVKKNILQGKQLVEEEITGEMTVKEQNIHFMPPFLMHIDRQCYKTPETHQYAFNKYLPPMVSFIPWLHYQELSQY